MIVRLAYVCGLVVATMTLTAPAMADEAMAAYLAGTCNTCHQSGDKSGAIPALAGRDAQELIAALQAYRTGGRRDALMHAVASSLSDSETTDVAAYFAQQEPAQ